MFLGLSVATGVLGAWLMFILATATPSLGVSLRAPSQGPGLIVDEVYESGPASGLVRPGARVLALAAGGETPLSLDARTVIEEPDFLLTYRERRAFFADQDRLHLALSAPAVTLKLADGSERVVRPQQRRASWLPAVFWFQLACGLIAILTGAAVFALRRGQTSARLYGFTGLAFATITYSAAVYSSRELALAKTTFRWLAAIDHLGSMCFAAGFVALIWHYPRRLGRFPIARLLCFVLGTVWVLDTWGLLPNSDWGIRIPMIVGLIVSLGLGVMQWRRAARDPVGRAGIRWFLFATLFGGTCFVTAIFLTMWLGGEPVISQGHAFGMVLSMYLGIAFGVARYRLFQLEQWWVSVWLWVVAGACIVVLDLAFAYVLNLNPTAAAGLSVLVIGWLYFPVRQWLLGWLTRGRDAGRMWLFPEVVKLVLGSTSATELSHGWRQFLRNLYDALEVADAETSVRVTAIAEEGLALCVPGVAEQPSTLLRFAQRGHRLFTRHDRDTVQALLELVDYALRQRDAYDRGVRSERERLARDLHDDIGSRLLTLVHRAGTGELAELSREALRELRTIVSTLGAGPSPLSEALADWRSEAAERCEAAGVAFTWHLAEPDHVRWLDATTRTNVVRVLREALSNALRHANPTHVEITASFADGVLACSVSDDGGSPDPETWTRGRGLSNIDHRIAELDGEHELSARTPSGTRLCFRIPLPTDREHEDCVDR